MALDPSLQLLVDNETLRYISSEAGEHHYVIDPLRHVRPTGFGAQIIIYSLIVRDDGAEEGRYEINEESEYQGGDNLLLTDDPDEVVWWIEECVERLCTLGKGWGFPFP